MVDNAAEPDGREGLGSALSFAHLVHVGWEVKPALVGCYGVLAPMLRAQQTVDELRDLARTRWPMRSRF